MFNVSPTSIAQGGSLTANGTGARKQPARIRVSSTDPETPSAQLTQFVMPANGRFSLTLPAPTGTPREVTLVLQQTRADGVWAQTASVKLLLIASGSGGGTPGPTPPPPDTTPPVISGIGSGSPTSASAVITWTTDEPADSQVEYGTTTGYGSTTTLATALVTSHSVTVSGLSAGTLYHYRVKSRDASGNLSTSGDNTLTTAAAATVPGAPTGLFATAGDTIVNLAWTAPASNGGSAITLYRVYRGGVSIGTTTSRTYTDTGRTNGVSYTYTVAAINAVGEGTQSASASATPVAGPDITAPVISNLVIDNVTTSGARVTWTTNESATGQVDYGTNISYSSQTTLSGLVTSHSHTLTGLASGTTYHVRARSIDAAGNVAQSSDRTFSTVIVPVPPTPGTPPPDMAAGTLQAIFNAASPGATITIPLGRYHESATVAKNLLVQWTPGSEITGDNTRTGWINVTANDVTFERLPGSSDPRPSVWVRNAALGAHQQAGFVINGVQRFTGRNLKMTEGPASILGMRDSDSHKFYDSEFANGRESLFGANKANHTEFHNCEFHHALGTFPNFNAGDEGGGGKFGGWAPVDTNAGSSGMLFDTCHFHDIVGNGPWADVKGNDAIWQSCRIHDVEDQGIFFEVSDNALVEDSVIYRAGRHAPAWGYGAGILASSSRGMIARRNLVYDCARGIVALSQTRVSAQGFNFNPGMAGNQFYDNTIIAKNTSDIYLMGFFRDWADPTFYNGTNVAHDNLFYHPSAEPQNGRFYRSRTGSNPYDGDYATLASFMAVFGDTTSRYLTTAEKDAALSAAGVPA